MGCGQIKDLNCVKLLNKLFNSLTKNSRVGLTWDGARCAGPAWGGTPAVSY